MKYSSIHVATKVHSFECFDTSVTPGSVKLHRQLLSYIHTKRPNLGQTSRLRPKGIGQR